MRWMFGLVLAAVASAAAASPDVGEEAPAPSSASFVATQAASASGMEAPVRGSAAYRAIILRETRVQGMPFEIADAVARIESSYRPDAIGGVGEVGLMQVRPTTAAMLGFRGTAADLADPETNIRYGVMYLARAWRLADGDLCRALMKYRAGHGEEQISPLSAEYCRRARLHLAGLDWSEGDRTGLDGPAPAAGAVAKAARGRSEHSLIAASRASIAAALSRVSARARGGAVWAEHAVPVRRLSAAKATVLAR